MGNVSNTQRFLDFGLRIGYLVKSCLRKLNVEFEPENEYENTYRMSDHELPLCCWASVQLLHYF